MGYVSFREGNIAHEKWWLGDVFSFWNGLFSGTTLASGRVETRSCMSLDLVRSLLEHQQQNNPQFDLQVFPDSLCL